MLNRLPLIIILAMSLLQCSNASVEASVRVDRLKSVTSKSFENIQLPSQANVTLSISQDNQGLMWIGTLVGLYSFDGHNYQQHYENGTLQSTYIHTIVQIDDKLYLGSDNGLLIYNTFTDSYEEGVEFISSVRALLKDGDRLYVGTLEGLYIYSLKDKKLERVAYELPNSTIYSLALGGVGELYIGTYNGLYRLSSGSIFEVRLPEKSSSANIFINSLLFNHKTDELWIGTEKNLFRYSVKDSRVEVVFELQNNSVKSLLLAQNDALHIATDNGLFIIDSSSKVNSSVNALNVEQIEHVTHDSRNSKSLCDNVVWSIFEDSHCNIWLATNGGISFNETSSSYTLIPLYDLTGSVAGNQFSAIFADSRNRIFFGGVNGLLAVELGSANAPQTTWYRMENRRHWLPHNHIRGIEEDSQKNIYIVSDGGVNRLNAKGEFEQISIMDSTTRYNSNWSYDIEEDSFGRFWVATCLGGVLVVDKSELSSVSSNIALRSFNTSNGLSSNFIHQVIDDNKGKMWVLNHNGVVNLISIDTFEVSEFHSDKLSSLVSYIYRDCDANIWIGSSEELLVVNPRTGQQRVVELSKNGANVISMTETPNEVWVATHSGVWRIDKATLNPQKLRLGQQTALTLYYDQSSNSIYIGGVDFIAIASAQIGKSNNAVPVVTQISVNGEIHYSKGRSIRYLDTIELDYRSNNLVFDFSVMNYSASTIGDYVYQLAGYEKEWHSGVENNFSASYSNLPYGSYSFVIAQIGGDSSNEPLTLIDVVISPPWYLSRYAMIGYLIVLGALVWLGFKLVVMRNRLRYERWDKERTLEQTNQKIEFFTNISHEFKTPLSLILAPISKLVSTTKDSKKRSELRLVEQNAKRLNTLIHRALEFEDGSRDDNWLMLSSVEFVGFVRELGESFDDTLLQKGVAFNFNANCERLYFDVDLPKIESMITNLLSNSVKFTPSQGCISVDITLRRSEEVVELTVKDSGVGIAQNELPHIFQRYYQGVDKELNREGTGIGLYLVKRYAQMHDGRVEVSSKVGQGTTVKVTLPLGHNSRIVELESSPESVEKPQEERQKSEIEVKAKLLIVDDNSSIVSFICDSFSEIYDCRGAYNGKEALEIATQWLPELIITDLMMPQMGGIELSKRLKKSPVTAAIPIIALTAKYEAERESLLADIDVYIQKPFDIEVLKLRAEQLLQRRQKIEQMVRIEAITEVSQIKAVSVDEKFLESVISIIESNLGDSNFNVSQLSNLSEISQKQLYRKLKAMVGMTPVDYIRSIRLKKASMLLRQGKFTVSEVMYMVGFSNSSYFAKCFETEFGVLPKDFVATEIRSSTES